MINQKFNLPAWALNIVVAYKKFELGTSLADKWLFVEALFVMGKLVVL